MHAAAAKIIATRTSAVTIAIVIISVTRRALPVGNKSKGKLPKVSVKSMEKHQRDRSKLNICHYAMSIEAELV